MTVVLGSVTKPGRLDRAVHEASDRARRDTADLEVLPLRELEIGWADGRPLQGDAARAVEALDRADAVILATPVYRGSLTAALKNLLDLTPVAALRGCPVGIVAMGGSLHHYLGADRHIRDLMTFFGALVAPVSVYLDPSDFDDGAPGPAAETNLDELMRAVLELASERGSAVPLGPAPLGTGRRGRGD
ncbi:NAD(P)H-dependent oxidoreductase [Thermoleophilia bacterium SCSIO 60948]|nr:NAD(P)H-dependent oxidoreductase [Thermoleophilia bacterium SCSIO 60948]